MQKPPGKPFTHDQLFGGTGAVQVWDLLGARAAGTFRAVLACELEVGARVGKHVQEQYEEVVVVTSGHGEASVNDTRHTLSSGSVVFLPLGSALALANTGAEPLRYLIVKATPAASDGRA